MALSDVYDVLREKFADALDSASYRGRVSIEDARKALDAAWVDWCESMAREARP
mgnify:CR=1 FL=1